MTWCTDPSASVLRIDAPLTADQVAEIRRRWQATAPTTGLLALTEPWAELPAGPALVLLEQHPDGTSLVAPSNGGLAAWVPTHLLTAHRLPDPFLPTRR
jgi:hypothetical protein